MGFSKVGPSLGAREIFELVSEELAKVEREMSLETVASVDAITAIGHYLQDSGGKRLRPVLLLLAARLAGGGGDAAVRLAAVVEMIHAATLVHDDVIDIASTRRGRPSPNVVWGNHTSVLAGDWLYMQAFQAALRERSFPVLEMLISLTQTMVEGELIQLTRIGRIDITEARYLELVERKTACLFSVSARLGAMAAGAGEDTVAELGEFAWNLGMAFQLVDDVLDFTARETVLGKPVGSDLREGKVTLPLIYALERAAPEEVARVETVLREGSYHNVPFAEMLDLVGRRGGIERAMKRAQVFRERAQAALARFPDSVPCRALCGLTELVTDRDH